MKYAHKARLPVELYRLPVPLNLSVHHGRESIAESACSCRQMSSSVVAFTITPMAVKKWAAAPRLVWLRYKSDVFHCTFRCNTFGSIADNLANSKVRVVVKEV